MANHVSHAALPYPLKGCRFTLAVPYLDADGDPLDPTTPDTERSIDGAAFADCTEEVSTITGSNGTGYITLTGDEMNGSLIAVAAKVASGPKATLATLYPRVLPVVRSGTAQAGAAGTITLDSGASAIDDYYNGMIVRTTGGTGGGGGSGSLGNQARVITDYAGSTHVATIGPNWETAPDATTTFEVLMTEMALVRYSDLQAWRGTQPNTLISGRVDSNVQAMANDVVTASAIATDAIGASEFAQGAADKVWSSATRTLTAFSTALAVAIWDVLESAIAVANSIGVKIKNTLPQRIIKNTALANFEFLMIDSTDHITGKTALTVTAERSIDGGAFAACANAVTEVSAGVYKISLAATDLNGDVITLKFTATGADARLITIVTEPAAA